MVTGQGVSTHHHYPHTPPTPYLWDTPADHTHTQELELHTLDPRLGSDEPDPKDHQWIRSALGSQWIYTVRIGII